MIDFLRVENIIPDTKTLIDGFSSILDPQKLRKPQAAEIQ